MLIVYDSMTGNVKRFTEKLSFPAVSINEYNGKEKYVFVTHTIGLGHVPEASVAFLRQHHNQMSAVAVSGNRNWGETFGRAGDLISNDYNVPLLCKFELSGTQNDVEFFTKGVDKIEELYLIKQ